MIQSDKPTNKNVCDRKRGKEVHAIKSMSKKNGRRCVDTKGMIHIYHKNNRILYKTIVMQILAITKRAESA